MIDEMPKIVLLRGIAKNYDWGGKVYIPRLISAPNPKAEPFAEYWLGAHPGGSSSFIKPDGSSGDLGALIQSSPQETLGEKVAQEFGSLPYLFKVLDAARMLSIQAHPNPEQARAGFERENRLGIALNAPHRNYKDANSKPEVHVALTDFYMLHGFKSMEEIRATFAATPAFRKIAVSGDLEKLYTTLMTMDQLEVDRILNQLIGDLTSEKKTLTKENPDYWALQASNYFKNSEGHRDRGLFSIYLLNLLHLKPGQGTYQGAGELHAYLEGVNMELMANSDNVLRGGLTPKHVDVPELLKTLVFFPRKPRVLDGEEAGGEIVYRTPAREFQLSRIKLSPARPYSNPKSFSAEILIVMSGSATIKQRTETQPLKTGDSVFICANTSYSINGEADIYKASVPAF